MRIIWFVVLSVLVVTPVFAEGREDILGKILNEVAFTREDLGYQPAGYWNRFPLDIPHKLTSFDALFAEPLKLYDYATVMTNTVELYLDPAYADSAHDGLYKLVYNLGVDKKRGGFRAYSANLLPVPEGDEPLATAIERLFALADRQTEFYTFGSRSDWPDVKKDIREKTKELPDSVKTILAELIVNLTDAIKWRNLAFRNCDREDMEKAFNIRDLANTQSDGTVYYPELDDIAETIDWACLHYAALKVSASAEKAEGALGSFINEIPKNFQMEFQERTDSPTKDVRDS